MTVRDGVPVAHRFVPYNGGITNMTIIKYTAEFGEETGMCVTVGHTGDAEGALRYVIDAADGEPLFVIRGRDVLAVPVIRQYVKEATEHGAYNQAMRANRHLSRFLDWQSANAKLTHMPDPLPDSYESSEGPRHRESRA